MSRVELQQAIPRMAGSGQGRARASMHSRVRAVWRVSTNQVPPRYPDANSQSPLYTAALLLLCGALCAADAMVPLAAGNLLVTSGIVGAPAPANVITFDTTPTSPPLWITTVPGCVVNASSITQYVAGLWRGCS